MKKSQSKYLFLLILVSDKLNFSNLLLVFTYFFILSIVRNQPMYNCTNCTCIMYILTVKTSNLLENIFVYVDDSDKNRHFLNTLRLIVLQVLFYRIVVHFKKSVSRIVTQKF